jgi:hypothetical protein
MTTYPDSNLIMEKARIIRQRTLPEGLVGEVLVKGGMSVTPDDVVAWATQSSDYLIVDVAAAVGLDPQRQSDQLEKLLARLKPGTALKAGDALGKSENKALSRRLPTTPANAIVSLVENGRVILQVNPKTVEVKARLAGDIIEVIEGVGVAIEAYGSLLQCAWGNGHYVAGRFAFEPDGSDKDLKSLRDLLKLDLALSPYTNKVLVLLRPLLGEDLEVLAKHELAGLVAPCAPPYLRDDLLAQSRPILLTEGFGSLAPTRRLYDLLYNRRTAQAIFDAALPNYRLHIRPEIIIPGGVGRGEAVSPHSDSPLSVGMAVKLRRAPYAGQVGVITALPENPQKLENGLRLSVAHVRLSDGDEVVVPQANVEYLGQAVQG